MLMLLAWKKSLLMPSKQSDRFRCDWVTHAWFRWEGDSTDHLWLKKVWFYQLIRLNWLRRQFNSDWLSFGGTRIWSRLNSQRNWFNCNLTEKVIPLKDSDSSQIQSILTVISEKRTWSSFNLTDLSEKVIQFWLWSEISLTLISSSLT